MLSELCQPMLAPVSPHSMFSLPCYMTPLAYFDCTDKSEDAEMVLQAAVAVEYMFQVPLSPPFTHTYSAPFWLSLCYITRACMV